MPDDMTAIGESTGNAPGNPPASGDLEIDGGGREPADIAPPRETFSVTCPECGGSLRIHEGERSIRCGYCGSALYTAASKGVRRFFLAPRATPGGARLEALHFLAEKTGGRIRARHASIMDMKLVNVPFWRMRGRFAGWVSGERISRKQVPVASPGSQGETVSYRTVEERTPYSKLVFKGVDWSTPACSVRHLGLQGISLKAQMLDWDIFDHSLKRKMDIALPMKTRREAERDGFKYLSTLATPAGATVRASRFRLLDSDLSLYYYPVFLMRYRHAGVIYSITVDGNDGHVVRGDVPERNGVDYRSMFFVPALAALMAGFWAPLIPIAAAVLYIADILRNGAIIPPMGWISGKLENWFGGEL